MKSPSNDSPIMEEINAWLTDLRKHGRSPRTIQTYRDALINLSRFIARHLITRSMDVRVEHLVMWCEVMVAAGRNAATINQYVRVVQKWFEWQVKSDRLFFNPAVDLDRPKPARTQGRCPSEADMRRLLQSVSGEDVLSLRDRALLELAYSTGARCEELTRIEVSAVDLSKRVVVLHGKGGRSRLAPLTTPAVNALATYGEKARPQLLRGRSDQAACFVSQQAGRRMACSAIASMVRRRAARVGLVISPHDIRRAFATHLLSNGAGLAQLKDLLGHSGYSHLHHYLKQAPTGMLATVRNSPLNR